MSRRGTCVCCRAAIFLLKQQLLRQQILWPADRSLIGNNTDVVRVVQSFRNLASLQIAVGEAWRQTLKAVQKPNSCTLKNCGLHYETSVNIWTMNIELDFLMAAQPHNDNTELLWLPYPYLKDMHACMSSRFFGCWHTRWVAYTISLSMTPPKPVFHCINMYSTQHCRSLLFRF